MKYLETVEPFDLEPYLLLSLFRTRRHYPYLRKIREKYI